MADEKETLELLRQVWSELDELVTGLSEDEWAAPTECPGWDVRDNLSHIAGTESSLLGRPAPQHEPPDAPHVRNAIGKQNEVAVDYRRSWPIDDVLADFREVTGERLAILEGMTSEEWAADSWTPVGPGSVLDFMQIRIFDSWIHEQDIRRAIAKPGNLDGAVARHALGRCLMALPFVVGKKAAVPEGSSVLVEVTGSLDAVALVQVIDGRAKQVEPGATEPTATIRCDFETFARLVAGRVDPADALASGAVLVEGDDEIGRRVVESMNVMI